MSVTLNSLHNMRVYNKYNWNWTEAGREWKRGLNAMLLGLAMHINKYATLTVLSIEWYEDDWYSEQKEENV